MYKSRYSIIPSDKKVAFFGASSAAEKILRYIDFKRDIECFYDNNEQKWGETFMGLPIRNPQELAQNPEDFFVIITSSFYDAVSEQLDKYGVDYALYKDCANIEYDINTDTIVFNITYRCSLKCNNCCRATSVISEDESTDMTVEQILRALCEIEECGQKFQIIKILGGEPTLHKDYKEICEIFLRHKRDFNDNLRIIAYTNGFSPYTKEMIMWTKTNAPEIEIVDSSKNASNEVPHHTYFLMAPCDDQDQSLYNYRYGCDFASTCGLSMDYSGIYCDSEAATIARVFNMDFSIKSFADVTQKRLKEQYTLACPKCGNMRKPSGEPNDNTKTYTSKTWDCAIKNYKGSKLVRY